MIGHQAKSLTGLHLVAKFDLQFLNLQQTLPQASRFFRNRGWYQTDGRWARCLDGDFTDKPAFRRSIDLLG